MSNAFLDKVITASQETYYQHKGKHKSLNKDVINEFKEEGAEMPLTVRQTQSYPRSGPSVPKIKLMSSASGTSPATPKEVKEQISPSTDSAIAQRVTTHDVVSMITKLTEFSRGTKVTTSESPSPHSSPAYIQSIKEESEQHGKKSEKPGFFMGDRGSVSSSNTQLSLQSRNRKLSKDARCEPIQWNKYEWMIAPLRKWDTVCAANNDYTTDPKEPVHIRYQQSNNWTNALSNSLQATHDLPVTIPTQVLHMVDTFPTRPLLAERDMTTGIWSSLTYQQALQEIELVSESIIHNNISVGSVALLVGNTCHSLITALLGCLFAAVPVMSSDNLHRLHPRAVAQIMRAGPVEIVICQHHVDAVFLAQHIEEYVNLKTVIEIESNTTGTKQIGAATTVCSWRTWLLGGKVSKQSYLTRLHNHLAPNKIALIKPQYYSITGSVASKYYTSSKIKDDNQLKCAMLTHDAVVHTTRRIAGALGLEKSNERWLSHLPWQQACSTDIIWSILLGITIYIAPSDVTEQGKLIQYTAETRPTVFLTTNTNWVHLTSEIKKKELVERESWIRRWAKRQGATTGLSLQMGKYTTVKLIDRIKFHIADRLVFSRLRRSLGLNKAYRSKPLGLAATHRYPRVFRLCVGHEELNDETKDYLRSINIPLLTWFMYTETGTVAITRDRLSQGNQYNQALLLDDLQCSSVTQNTSELSTDELCFASRGNFSGYMGEDTATVAKYKSSPAALCVKSGGHGAKYKNLVLISKRLDRYIITNSGRCIEYEPIQQKILAYIPNNVVQDCVLLGEGMKKLILLISLKTAGAQGLQLSPPVVTWCKKLGSEAKTVHELLGYRDTFVLNELLRIIKEVNSYLHSQDESICSFAILPRPMQEGVEIDTQTQTIRRYILTRVYGQVIRTAYDMKWKALE